MAYLAASYIVKRDTLDQVSLTTASFVPDTDDVLVVKAFAASNVVNPGLGAAGGWSYTLQADEVTSGSNARIKLWTATVITGGSAMTVTVTFTGASVPHMLVVERWASAVLDPSPVVTAATGTGTPNANLTTTTPFSGISLGMADWNAVDGAGRVYNTSTDVPDEGAYHFVSGQYTAESATIDSASMSAHTLGLTAPTGQQWVLVAVEILDPGGPEALNDPLPPALLFRPPGRIAPRGTWSPMLGRDSRPPRTAAPTYPSGQVLVEGTGTRAFGAVTTAAGDWLVVGAGTEIDNNTSGLTPSCPGLTFQPLNDTGQGAGVRARVFQWAARDLAGGSRTVTLTPAGTRNYRGDLTVVRGSDGPGSHTNAPASQQVSLNRLDDHSGVFMTAVDFVTSGTIGTPTWTPGSTTSVGQDGTAADYAFGRWDDAGMQATALHGVATPTLTTPACAALEMLGTTAAAGSSPALPDAGSAADDVAVAAVAALDAAAAADDAGASDGSSISVD
jgi:hypothetical protein